MLEALGSLTGGLAGQLGDALSAPRRAVWSALGLPESGSDLASSTLGLDPEGAWAKALGFGAEVLGDPLTYAGGLIGKAAGAAGKAFSGGAELAPMLGARRGFTMFKDAAKVGEVAGVPKYVGRAVGGVAGPETLDMLGQVADKAAGIYDPATKAGAAFATAPGRNVPRHEAVHGLIDAAMGNPEGMPLAVRAAAGLLNSQQPFVHGLGRIANEAVAHGLEHRGLMNQLSGAGTFLLNPRNAYADIVGEVSPLAAALYKSAPWAAFTGVGALGGAAAGALAGGQ